MTSPSSRQPSRPIAVVTVEEALRTIQHVGETLEDARQQLAQLYAAAPGGTSIEHGVGEMLTQVRKTIERTRKAIGELAQQELPFE